MCSWSNLDFPLFWLICTIFLGSGGRALKPDCFHKSFGRQVLHKSGSDGCWYQDSLSLLLLLFGVFIYLFIFNFFIVYTITAVLIFPHPASPPPFLRTSANLYLCLWVVDIHSLANPFTLFHPVPPPV